MHCTMRVPSAAHSMLSAGYNLLAHSKNELMRWRGVCRLCVCKLFLRESLLRRQKWLDRYQTCTGWSPCGRASTLCSRSRSRSKVTSYGHFCPRPKIAFSRRQMARLQPNLHTMKPFSCQQKSAHIALFKGQL